MEPIDKARLIMERAHHELCALEDMGGIRGHMLSGGLLSGDMKNGFEKCDIFVLASNIHDDEIAQILEGVVSNLEKRRNGKRGNTLNVDVNHRGARIKGKNDNHTYMDEVIKDMKDFPRDTISKYIGREIRGTDRKDINAAGTLGMFEGCYALLSMHYPHDVITMNMMLFVIKKYMHESTKHGVPVNDIDCMDVIFNKMYSLPEFRDSVYLVDEHTAIKNIAQELKQMMIEHKDRFVDPRSLHETCRIIIMDLCITSMTQDEVYKVISEIVAEPEVDMR